MSDSHQVPPDVTDSGDRIKGRDYESDFAQFPRSEIHARTGPGGGPQGPVAEGLNKAMMVMAIGALIAFGVFFVNSWIVLGLGLLLVFAGAAMSIVTHHRPGRRSGIGPSQVSDSPPR